ncbi:MULTISPECIES: hypothetical protein [unclassified Streptomyces]|uniref:hypothetical protein n=1 Tax=unclassified Streptomyces TaxID=2593676 RepID=UPI0024A930FF|nr:MULTISPECIES: hypothetical protein [unclassified Streptomyces]
MEYLRSWCDVKTPADALALREEFDRRAQAAATEARMYERLRDTVADIPRLGQLWDELVANPVDLAIVLPADETPDTGTPAQSDPPEQQLDVGEILTLMGQTPQRLWSAEDVRAALGAASRRDVRQALRGMAAQGLLEEVQRKARHVLFRIASPAPPSA